jgi:hypothetical protein
VVADDINSDTDSDSIYLIKDPQNLGGKSYCHVLRDTLKKPSRDIFHPRLNDATALTNKLTPIVYSSNEQMIMYVWLEVKKSTPAEDLPIDLVATAKTVGDLGTTYLFEKSTLRKIQSTGNYDYYQSLLISKNTPFKGKIEFFEKFDLSFEYTASNHEKCSAGTCSLRLYITQNKSIYHEPDRTAYKMSHSLGNSNLCMLETLLYMGCSKAKGLPMFATNQEEKILTAIFDNFQSKKVVRVRDGHRPLQKQSAAEKHILKNGLGYWRDASAAVPKPLPHEPPFNRATRSLGYLLAFGTACCGEWADLFSAVCATQGMDKIILKQLSLSSTIAFPIKGWKINDPKAPTLAVTPNVLVAQGNSNPLHMFWDHVFNYIHISGSLYKVFDPSYGISFSVEVSKEHYLEKYYPCGPDSTKQGIKILKTYSNFALAGFLDSKLISNCSTKLDEDHIIKDPHSGLYLDPDTNIRLLNKTRALNYARTYRTLTYEETLSTGKLTSAG